LQIRDDGAPSPLGKPTVSCVWEKAPGRVHSLFDAVMPPLRQLHPPDSRDHFPVALLFEIISIIQQPEGCS
jgi:hypothetical protein